MESFVKRIKKKSKKDNGIVNKSEDNSKPD